MKRAPVILLLAVPLFCVSCKSGKWVRAGVVDEKDCKVSLEHLIVKEAIIEKNYDHPYSFDARELEEILKGLQYQSPRLFRDPEMINVFYKKEAGMLATHLSEALGVAHTWQRVRFVSYNYGGGLIFSARRKTEGVIFLEAGHRLNIAFTQINEELDPRDVQDPDRGMTYRDPLVIFSSNSPLVPKAWYDQHYSVERSRTHPLWIVVDLNKSRKMLEEHFKFKLQPLTPEEKPAEEEKPVPVVESRPDAAGETQAAPPPEPAPIAAEQATPEEKALEKDDLKQSLQRLKEYYEEGLIDEEEYKKKKEEILKKLK
jgi:hypothetical protein